MNQANKKIDGMVDKKIEIEKRISTGYKIKGRKYSKKDTYFFEKFGNKYDKKDMDIGFTLMHRLPHKGRALNNLKNLIPLRDH